MPVSLLAPAAGTIVPILSSLDFRAQLLSGALLHFGKVLFFLSGPPFALINIRPTTRTSLAVSPGLLSFCTRCVQQKKEGVCVMKLGQGSLFLFQMS